MRRYFTTAIILLALSAPHAAAEQQPQQQQSPRPQGQKRMTMEDVLAMRNVGAPQWSPDSKWLAFTISD